MAINAIVGGMSPDEESLKQRKALTIQFWSELRISDETGQTSWNELEPMELEAADLVQEPLTELNVLCSEGLVAKALGLIVGKWG